MRCDINNPDRYNGGLLNEEKGPDPVPEDPNLWLDLGVFRGLSKRVSSHPNPHTPLQQTTDKLKC
jgi:hypothetical protein